MNHPLLRKIQNQTEILVGILVLIIVGLIVIPLPTFMLDLLLALNMGIAVLIFLLSIFAKSVLEFSVFPTILLVTTLFRLGLNVSSTRLILSTGNPGEVVTLMGQFLTKGDMVVGSVIFIIICIVQFMVITNGSSRVAEVSARFSLDSMPGKQMAIDAELNAGAIDDKEARRRRAEVQMESSFYGAMDGASKFVKGDAIAGIIIVLINFVGGIIIFSMKGYEVMDAIQKFGLLTIGDGLVSSFPALLISTATGFMITKTGTENSLGSNLTNQLFSIPKALGLASGAMLLLALIPALPFIPFFVLGIWLGVMAYLMNEKEKERLSLKNDEERAEAMANAESHTENDDDVSRFLKVELFEVEFGHGLLQMATGAKGDEVFERINKIRKQIVQELGVIVPSIRIGDNIRLKSNQYVIKIKGNKVAEGELYPERFMVINLEQDSEDFEGINAVDPSFGFPARWVEKQYKMKAENLGYAAVDDVTVLITHLKETIRRHAHELVGRQELKAMLNIVKEHQPDVVGDLIPDVLPLGDVLRVTKSLLREGVSIRDMGTILETLADYAQTTKDTEVLTEYVRCGLSRKVVAPYLNRDGVLEVINLDEELEVLINQHIQRSFQGTFVAIDPVTSDRIHQSIQLNLNAAIRSQKNPVVLMSPQSRPAFRRMIELSFPSLAVLSLNDVPSNVQIRVIGRIDIKNVYKSI